MASPRQSIDARVRARTARTSWFAATVVAALALSACATGQRPSFDADQPLVEDTGDAAVDAVLDRLDAVGIAQFTAGYTVLTRLGGLGSAATVVQADNSRRSITINDVRFLDGPSNAATCNLTTAECEAVINDARVSDVQLTHDFYASGPARRLRVDEARKLAPATGYEATIADRPATCADVPVSGGTKTYCALDSGVLAKYDGNDLLIELVSFSDVPDETRFETG
jgi:hypothetical protein